MMETPWGALAVSDAHVHFFSHRFFAALAEQMKAPVDSLAPVLSWQLPAEDPKHLAGAWVQELDRHGVSKAALIASVPGDQESVIAAVGAFPQRFYGYMMVNPVAPSPPPMWSAPWRAVISTACVSFRPCIATPFKTTGRQRCWIYWLAMRARSHSYIAVC